MKDAYYFSHDSNARNDLKMVRLRKELGLSGVGLFWCVIEMLRESDGYKLPLTEISSICYDLRTDEKDFEKLFDCGLLQQKNKFFFSESLLQRMERLDEIKIKRAESGRIGGQNKASNSLANAKQMLSKTEAKVKQNVASIVKHSIVNDSIEYNSKEINNTLAFAREDYRKILIDWFDYKKARKESYKSDKSIQAFYNKLLKFSGGSQTKAVEIIDQSMANNWAGIFELKKDQPKKEEWNRNGDFYND